jgi:hypothetical protein
MDLGYIAYFMPVNLYFGIIFILGLELLIFVHWVGSSGIIFFLDD